MLFYHFKQILKRLAQSKKMECVFFNSSGSTTLCSCVLPRRSVHRVRRSKSQTTRSQISQLHRSKRPDQQKRNAARRQAKRVDVVAPLAAGPHRRTAASAPGNRAERLKTNLWLANGQWPLRILTTLFLLFYSSKRIRWLRL